MAEVQTSWLDSDGDRLQAAGVSARALRDNPTSLAVSDDPLVRLELFYGVFIGMLKDAPGIAARRGECVLGVAAATAPGESCVGRWLPPEARILSDPGPDASALDRLVRVGSVSAANDLGEDHWHVGPVAVEPGFQGTGIGHAVMRMLCDHFDDQGDLAWLETDKIENVSFYTSLGFELVKKVPCSRLHRGSCAASRADSWGARHNYR